LREDELINIVICQKKIKLLWFRLCVFSSLNHTESIHIIQGNGRCTQTRKKKKRILTFRVMCDLSLFTLILIENNHQN